MDKLEYLSPQTLAEAAELKNCYGREGRILAGGTDLLVNLKDRVIACQALINIKSIPEMNEISFSNEYGLSVGGAVTLNQLIENCDVQREYPVLIDSAKTLANSLLRNRATLLGNLCNASPAGDMLPASLVLEGLVEAMSIEGRRWISLNDFFIGVKKNALKDNEIAIRVVFPIARGKAAFTKKSRIKGHDLSQLCTAAMLGEDGSLAIALGAAGPVPVCLRLEGSFDACQLQEGEVLEYILNTVRRHINPISDQRASREYRLAMAEYLTCQTLNKISKEV